MSLGSSLFRARKNKGLSQGAAAEELAPRLRTGTGPEDCPVFPLAAACLALGLRSERGAVERFSAGDLSIDTGGGRRGAALREQVNQH